MRDRLALLVALAVAAAPLSLLGQGTSSFDHAKHRKVFATCTACHLGAAERGTSIWPDPASCASCHDGTIQKRVTWQPRREPARTNLRFDHVEHARAAAGRPAACVACHQEQGAAWMTVAALDAQRCVDCHGIRTAHLTAPEHKQPVYAGAAGHGQAARAAGVNCAICHAREFCLQCHVDAPERREIQTLASDPRSAAIRAELRPPASHDDPDFLARHGTTAVRAPESCAACHTRESCLTCHAATTRVAARLPAASPDRGRGAVVTRRRPPSHGANYAARHAAASAAGPACAACHSRSDCLECHRPDAARAAGYHPPGFLARHPAAAYARETSCSDCHNSAGFCTTCHATAGLVSKGGPLRPGYHDVNNFFIAGHGQAARQSLETCVGCHVEKDCVSCHSALGSRRINPHGPGFDANRLKQKNPQMCTACHGTAIPTR